MPELPEVETVKRTLQRLIIGKTVEDVDVFLPKIIKEPSDVNLFVERLRGRKVTGLGRRGKFLKIFFDPWVLVSHMRMEGRYRLLPREEPLEKHTHVVFRFADGTDLRYRDVRQFGTMHLFLRGEEERRPPLNKLGPEPLSEEFTLERFRKRLSGRTTRLKALLLNQEFLSGLGNIYVDEALFEAGLHPERPVPSLSEEESERLFRSIRSTLERAVEAGGSTVRSYVDGNGEMGMFQLQIQVYGRRGEPCPRCGGPIQRLVVAGRGTHLCPKCQR
ncbi:DNA-(apurinic or apyrimidinic site) lyase [Planifilum fulgidum]|uniref:Formamidopyrimidine-DNA glycosylase n=1 Tax=Planifilum fulgidum TaxID=201973 RepID=A0A1I2MA41_9BACL|nr:DNA-formamidopyrimidine glycosylase [Planifilum fulgidum]MBO2498168.1 DNA-formamidopyrimidine glycosylase [Bacillota bacterium]MBO2534097.1 DNA-formamidopyrimidine glycosylase [Thermoactinomycetaceae bacterium]SFF86397.1 DNA-(apurinic or apyrimidinic site) lyase [Planifilum fulgidum]